MVSADFVDEDTVLKFSEQFKDEFENEFNIKFDVTGTIGSLCDGCVVQFDAKNLKNAPIKGYREKVIEALRQAFIENIDDAEINPDHVIFTKKDRLEINADFAKSKEVIEKLPLIYNDYDLFIRKEIKKHKHYAA